MRERPARKTPDHDCDKPEHDTYHQEYACDPVLDGIAARPGPCEKSARSDAQARHPGRCAKVLMLDAVTAKHHGRDIDAVNTQAVFTSRRIWVARFASRCAFGSSREWEQSVKELRGRRRSMSR